MGSYHHSIYAIYAVTHSHFTQVIESLNQQLSSIHDSLEDILNQALMHSFQKMDRHKEALNAPKAFHKS